MNSFYGGKQGNSFIIAQTYTTIQEMLDDFGKNNRSCAVNFDEYVLINTVNKNNPENGQVFRRGYDYNSSRKIKTYQPTYGPNPYETIEVPANGAIYIGTIVGPAGRAPIFNFGHYEDVQDSCALLIRTFAEIALNVSDSQQTIVTTLNKNYPNGKEILKEGELEKSFYSLKIVDNLETPSIYLYFCYDNKYKLSNQEYGGWYAVDSIPTTGEDSFRPEDGKGLIPGITYAYEDGKLQYVVDPETKKRSIKTGLNYLGNTYQDTIDWTYCTVRNENLEDSTAYIGFRFASPVVEFETESVNPYFHRNDTINESGEDPTEDVPDEQKTNKFENLNLIERIQTEEEIKAHPFYSKWKINIPKGIKGESIKNIYIVDAATAKNIKQFVLNNGELTYADNGAIIVEDYKEDMSPPENEADIESSKNKMIIVYDYVCYDRLPEGEKHTIYLGDFNKLDGIKLEHYGELVFDYSHDNTERTPQEDWIHWIDKMHFNEDGTVTITFNDLTWNAEQADNQDEIKNGVLTKTHLFHWINQMNFADDGTLTVNFNNEDLNDGQIEKGNITLPQLIKWITEVKLNTENGKFEIDFNYPEKTNKDGSVIPNTKTHYETDLTWVKNITFKTDGTVITDYTTEYDGEDKDENGNRVQEYLMSWINQMAFNDDGTVIINFNNNSLNDGQINQGVLKREKLINWINHISLDKETGKIYIEFNNDSIVGENINKKTINTEEGPKEVSYYQDYLTWVKDITFDENGTITTDYTTDFNEGVDKRVQSQLIKWIKEVSLDEDNGHFNITFNQFKENEDGTLSDEFQQYNNNLQWIKNIEIDNHGTVKYDGTQQDYSQNKLIKWINEFSLDEDDGHLVIKFNNDQFNTGQVEQLDDENQISIIDKKLTWVKDIQIDPNDGQVTIDYTNLDNDTNTKLQWIKNITIANDGTVEYDGTQQDSTQEKLLTWITSCSFNETTGNLKVNFNNNKTVNNINTTINFIKQVAVTPTGQVLVLYSDPNKQGTISYNGINGWTQMSQLSYSQYLSVDSTDTIKNNVINNLTPGASCYWIEEIE